MLINYARRARSNEKNAGGRTRRRKFDVLTRADSLASVSILEGPAYGPDDYLYFSDIQANRLMRCSRDGRHEVVFEDSGRANGNVFDLEGRLITCEGAEYGPGGRRRMVLTELATHERHVLTERYEGRRYNSPNDVCVDSTGRIFFTDPRYGDRSDLELDVEGVYRIDVDGTVHRILEQPAVQRPNGVAVGIDDRVLYVVDSNHDRDGNRCIWSFELDADGEPTKQRLVFDFAPGRGGDGIELDSAGRLFVCAGILQPRSTSETTDYPPGVYLVDPDGRPHGMISVPEDLITNCCFGGDDLRTLYVTAGRTVYTTEVEKPGYHAFPAAVEEKRLPRS